MRVINRTNALLKAESEMAEAGLGHAQGRLLENEIFGYGLLENLPNAVLIINPDTSIRYVNPALENLTGFSSDEVVGRRIPYPWWIWGTDPEKLDNNVETAPGRVHNYELYRKKSGELFWADLTSVPVVRDGKLRHYISSWIDITKYKKVEKQFIELNTYHQTILEGITHGILVTDANDIIRYSNENLMKITGMSPGNMYGRSICIDILGNTIGCTCNHYFKAKKALHPLYHHEIPAVTPGGQKTYQSIYLVPIVTSGVFNGMIITVEDVKEQVKVEKRLSKHEEISQLKNDLLAKVSHELRTPLASIKGYSTLLLEYEPRLKTKEKREYLELIDSTTSMLTKLVSQLLDMSHLQAGLYRFKKASTNISKLLQQVIAEAKLRSPGQEIVNNSEKWLPSVNVDAGRIKQVMENLLDNACKYSSKGTKVVITACRKDQELIVSVADNGIGIPEDELERIFDKMYRVEQSQSLEKPGLGLGLTICREIVEAHGGRIWAESQPGKGSVFSFALPIHNHNHNNRKHT
jgi:PAS domain S-box-containing protein